MYSISNELPVYWPTLASNSNIRNSAACVTLTEYTEQEMLKLALLHAFAPALAHCIWRKTLSDSLFASTGLHLEQSVVRKGTKQWLRYLSLDTHLLLQGTVCLYTLQCCIQASGSATCLEDAQPSACERQLGCVSPSSHLQASFGQVQLCQGASNIPSKEAWAGAICTSYRSSCQPSI